MVGRTNWAIRTPAALGLVVGLLGFGATTALLSAASQANVSEVTGAAFGYEAQISLFGGEQPHDGPAPSVTLAGDGSNSPQTATASKGLVRHGPAVFFTSDTLQVSSQGTTGASGSESSSSDVLNVNRSTTQKPTTGSEIFSADNVHSACSASGTISRSTTLKNAVLQTDNGDDQADGTGGVHPAVNMDLPSNPPPNFGPITGHIHVNGAQDNFHVVFNEQILNADGSITVNAVHEFLDGPTAKGFLIIGHAVCGTTNGPGSASSPGTSAPKGPTTTSVGNSTSSSTSLSTDATDASTSSSSSSTSSTLAKRLAGRKAKDASDTLPLVVGGLALVALAGLGAVLLRRRRAGRGNLPT